MVNNHPRSVQSVCFRGVVGLLLCLCMSATRGVAQEPYCALGPHPYPLIQICTDSVCENFGRYGEALENDEHVIVSMDRTSTFAEHQAHGEDGSNQAYGALGIECRVEGDPLDDPVPVSFEVRMSSFCQCTTTTGCMAMGNPWARVDFVSQTPVVLQPITVNCNWEAPAPQNGAHTEFVMISETPGTCFTTTLTADGRGEHGGLGRATARSSELRADDYIVTCADGKIFCPLNDRHCQSPDPDRDGIDTNDNCPFHYNPDQGDFDLDGKGDVCD